MKSSYQINFKQRKSQDGQVGFDIKRVANRLAIAKLQPAVTSLPGFSELKMD